MGGYLLGLDLGTTVCKAVVCDRELRILSKAEIEYPLSKLSAVAFEQDAELWWSLSKRMMREALVQGGN